MNLELFRVYLEIGLYSLFKPIKPIYDIYNLRDFLAKNPYYFVVIGYNLYLIRCKIEYWLKVSPIKMIYLHNISAKHAQL